MREIKNMMFTIFLLVAFLSFLHVSPANSNSNLNELEANLMLIEEVSKIEQVKSLNNEIKQKENQKKDKTTPTEENTKRKKEMKINSNLTVNGGISSRKIIAEAVNISGQVNVAKSLKAFEIISDKITVQTTVTDRLISPTGVLTIEGDLIISNDLIADTVAMRGSSFIVEGVKQWGLVHHDDFETEKSLEGWSDKRTGRCREGGNTFLGGHCHFSYNEVSKIFTRLQDHKHLRVTAAYHMFDSWEGEMGYMKINGEIVWTKKGEYSKEKGIDICGGDYNDPALNIPIDVTIPHTGDEVKVTFGSTLDEEPCNESFGIDDVMIYVK